MSVEESKTITEVVSKMQEQYRILFQNNPLSLDVLTDLVSDLFIMGSTPLEQDRANKALTILANLGILRYEDRYPTFESVRKMLQKII
jgi:hypothetical protein